MRHVLTAIAYVLLFVGGAALVVGHFGEQCVACDAVNIGFAYWFAASVAGAALLSIVQVQSKRRWWPIVVAAALSLVFATRSTLPAAASCANSDAFDRLRIVAFNASMDNEAPDAAARWLVQMRPDVIALVEAKGGSAQIPALLRVNYPHQLSCHARLACSTYVLSRLRPIMQQQWGRGDVENRKGLSAVAMSVVSPGGQAVTVVGVHLSRLLPLTKQRGELSALAARLDGIDPASLIVAGDFNTTRDTMTLQRFGRDRHLARVPSGPTWPTSVTFPGVPSLLAIDHVFLGRALRLADYSTGPVIGSDHRPVIVDVCLGGPKDAANL